MVGNVCMLKYIPATGVALIVFSFVNSIHSHSLSMCSYQLSFPNRDIHSCITWMKLASRDEDIIQCQRSGKCKD